MQAFPGIEKLRYEGPKTKTPLAFRHYDDTRLVDGKPMREHLRFAVAYWHTFRGTGADPFGPGTLARAWDDGSDSLENATRRVRVAFEFFEKLGAPFYCFHDRDVAPEGATLAESHRHLDAVASVMKQEQQRSGVGLLWGTANLFSHPRYAHGAATSPNVEVFAHAAAQVKKCLEVTHELGGANYVFWGGREGYCTLYNTDMKRELDHLARFLHMAHEHKQKIGFAGQLLVEPKPREPMKHQYDYDVGNVLAFLRAYDLTDKVKLNVETNHATLAGHEMMHELELASSAGLLGSVDANFGDTLLGWDTDQFPTNLYLATQVMHVVLAQGGLSPGGLNFDAKVRRESTDPEDLFHAHAGAMDAFARGLVVADAMRRDGVLQHIRADRYASWESDLGRRIESGKGSLAELEALAMSRGNPMPTASGRQERIENIVNDYLLTS